MFVIPCRELNPLSSLRTGIFVLLAFFILGDAKFPELELCSREYYGRSFYLPSFLTG